MRSLAADLGKTSWGEHRVGEYGDSLKRVAAVSVRPHAAPGRDEGKVRPLARQNLVAGDLDLLSQDPQLLVAEQCLVDQGGQHRIIEKLFDLDLG